MGLLCLVEREGWGERGKRRGRGVGVERGGERGGEGRWVYRWKEVGLWIAWLVGGGGGVNNHN